MSFNFKNIYYTKLFTFILSTLVGLPFLNAGECLSTLRYSNGQILKSGDHLYYPNGNRFKLGNNLFYPSGNRFKSGGNLFYPNGLGLKIGNNFYYHNGIKLMEGSHIYYRNGFKLKIGDNFYHRNGFKARVGTHLYRENGMETTSPLHIKESIDSFGLLNILLSTEEESISLDFSNLINSDQVRLISIHNILNDLKNETIFEFLINSGNPFEEIIIYINEHGNMSCSFVSQ